MCGTPNNFKHPQTHAHQNLDALGCAAVAVWRSWWYQTHGQNEVLPSDTALRLNWHERLTTHEQRLRFTPLDRWLVRGLYYPIYWGLLDFHPWAGNPVIRHAHMLVLLEVDHETQPGGARHTTSMVHMSADEHQEANLAVKTPVDV